MKKEIVLLSIVLGILASAFPFQESARAAPPGETGAPSCNFFGIQRFRETKEAPPFSLQNLDGNQISLGDFKGKPVLITFWATWCDTCKEEMPLLDKFAVGKRDQVAFLLITIDGERKKAAEKVVKENKITLPVLLLLKEKTMDQYGVRGWVPQTFIIDREGKLVGKIVGPRDWGSPEAWSCLKELLELR